MINPAVMTFTEALAHSERANARHILLGNGFSIACRPDIFVYGKLFERADFARLSPAARNTFKALGTEDFEKVIKALRDAARLIPLYGGVNRAIASALERDANGLKEVLAQTIAHSHPARPGDITDREYEACRAFLAHFKTIYSMNYDLLLYWTQMHTLPNQAPGSDDGFRKSEDDLEAGYVVWEPGQSHEQNTWFLHGASHVFDTGTEVQKYTWINTGIPLIDQIRDALNRGYFPLFVAEGSSAEKLERIRHSDYLAKAYRSFSEIAGALFVLGHSLANNDEHYLKRIERGKIRYLFVGLHGEAIQYWNRIGLKVRPWVYRAYQFGGHPLIEIAPFRSADDPLEDLAESQGPGFYVVNTNWRNDEADDLAMLAEKKVAAFFDPWKLKIARLKKIKDAFIR